MSDENRRNVLVISSVERPVAVLREALGGDVDELKVVVPAVKQSRLQWLTNADDDAREERRAPRHRLTRQRRKPSRLRRRRGSAAGG